MGVRLPLQLRRADDARPRVGEQPGVRSIVAPRMEAGVAGVAGAEGKTSVAERGAASPSPLAMRSTIEAPAPPVVTLSSAPQRAQGDACINVYTTCLPAHGEHTVHCSSAHTGASTGTCWSQVNGCERG